MNAFSKLLRRQYGNLSGGEKLMIADHIEELEDRVNCLIDRIEEIVAQNNDLNAAIPVAYQMGLDAGELLKQAVDDFGNLKHSDSSEQWGLRLSRCLMELEAYRALTPPADLVERVLKGGE